jgi:ABC-type Zn uptake system ZnuABC Zn-binding protein ZnuA
VTPPVWLALRLSIIPAALFSLVLAVVLASCGAGDAKNSRVRIVATTVQVTALAKEVGGDSIDLRGIIPAGADAHNFEPKASDVAAAESAQLILRNGIGLDDWLDGTLAAGLNATVVTVTDGITPRKSEEDGGQVDDPHVWHDPDNDKVMVDNIAAALQAADPAHKATYEANASAYKTKLDETKVQVQAIIDEISSADRKLVTNHDAFAYFAEAFGLEVVGAVIPSVSSEAEPSAKDTAALLDTIRRERVKAIFAESSVNPKLATTLAHDAGVTIVDDLYGDSLGPSGSGAGTVDGMLLVNARKIADALK